MSGEESDFFATYKAVSSKLKKRFLKKPSLADMSADFGKLARSLDEKGCSQYAGLCCLAMARCEQSMSANDNSLSEIEAQVRASRYFINSDAYLEMIKCPNFREHLRSAVDCYDQAIVGYQNQGLEHLAGSLCIELGDYLHKSRLKSEALLRYQQAVNLFDMYPTFSVLALRKIAELRIELKNYLGALDACTSALRLIKEKGGYHPDRKTLVGSFFELHTNVELLAVFLLMYLNFNPLKISAEHSAILQKFVWSGSSEENEVTHKDSKLFILVQSFVMACSSQNIKALQYLEPKLEVHLTPTMSALVKVVVDEYKNPKFIT